MATSVKLSDVVPSRFAHLTPSDETNIERIRADLETGTKLLLNVPHVFKNEDDKYELLAGHDRTEAFRRAKPNEQLPVRDFSGTVNSDDAILAHFCRENLLRKDISKAAIAGEWLRKHPDWSDGKIADESGCTAPHVGTVRAELGIANPKVLSGSREGRDGRVREVKPRQPRIRTTTPDKPKSLAEHLAEPTTVENPAPPSAVAPKAPSVVTGVMTSEAETKAPEPAGDVGSTVEAAGQRAEPAETGAPVGVVSAVQSQVNDAVPPQVFPADPAVVGVGAVGPDVSRSSVVAEYVARLDGTPPKVEAAEYRLAFHVLSAAQIENARAWHRFLGTTLLQLDIERDNTKKLEMAGAA